MLRDDTFPGRTMAVLFEKQQAWLENIIQGKFSVIEQAIDQEQVVIEAAVEDNGIILQRKSNFN